MRIVYVTNGVSGPGGLERVLSIKANYFAEVMKYDIHILTLNSPLQEFFYEFSKAITFHNISAQGNPFSYILSYSTGIKTALKKIQPDIVCVCDDGLKGLLLPLFIGKNYPMIYERHVSKNIEIKKENTNFFEKIKSEFKFKIMNFGGALYDRFIVLTKGNTNEWPIQNIQVIPNPLSFYPDNDALSTLHTKRVLAVGKQSFQKGYDRLLQSWKIVVDKHPDWVLDIYGTFSEKEALPQLAKKLGIQRHLNLFVPVKNIAEKYKEAAIYVMSSRYEGFGMVLTEAMAYGVPCVSFDCPYGPSDIITHNQNGILVPNNDINSLAIGILTLIENTEQRKRMGAKSRVTVQRYQIEKIAMEWEGLFKSLIRNK